MPSRAVTRPTRTRRRWWWRILLVALVLTPLALFPFLGRLLVAEDPLQPADAIVVLAGSRVDRWLEAVDLRADGFAASIVLSRGQRESGEDVLARRGIRLPDAADLARGAMIELGVPAEAVTYLPEEPDSTAGEAAIVRRLADASGWRRIIVVTSKQHTRRARLAFRRELDGSGIEPIVRASRYDVADPPRWWRTRRGLRETLFEWIKLVAYTAGLGA